jgi:dihydrofolate synthase/folylpolyglutamate synthase
VLLDGAHNPAGARALARAMDELEVRDVPVVFGATRGKRVTAMLRALAERMPRFVFTSIGEPSALPAERLLTTWRGIGAGGEAVADVHSAVERAAGLRRDAAQPVVVAGSLYLVGAVRGWLLGGVPAA